jgi:hypothetical protein
MNNLPSSTEGGEQILGQHGPYILETDYDSDTAFELERSIHIAFLHRVRYLNVPNNGLGTKVEVLTDEAMEDIISSTMSEYDSNPVYSGQRLPFPSIGRVCVENYLEQKKK